MDILGVVSLAKLDNELWLEIRLISKINRHKMTLMRMTIRSQDISLWPCKG